MSGTTQTIGRRLNGDFATGMARRTKGSGEREGTFGTGMERIGLSPESLSKGSFAEGMMRAPNHTGLHQGTFAEGSARSRAA